MAPQTDIKRGSAELMVLAAIEERARHGYEVAKLIRAATIAPVVVLQQE